MDEIRNQIGDQQVPQEPVIVPVSPAEEPTPQTPPAEMPSPVVPFPETQPAQPTQPTQPDKGMPGQV